MSSEEITRLTSPKFTVLLRPLPFCSYFFFYFCIWLYFTSNVLELLVDLLSFYKNVHMFLWIDSEFTLICYLSCKSKSALKWIIICIEIQQEIPSVFIQDKRIIYISQRIISRYFTRNLIFQLVIQVRIICLKKKIELFFSPSCYIIIR